jgi:hypothetical protein
VLFDLQSRGRRRTVKVVYSALAILMAVGLLVVGVSASGGGGGILDIFTSADPTGNDALVDRAKRAQERATANPKDPEAWAALAQARYRVAGSGELFDTTTGTFTTQGKAELRRAAEAWQRYLALEPDPPSRKVANVMVQVYGAQGLADVRNAYAAQEIVARQNPTPTTYSNLAILGWQAGRDRVGDLAATRAVDLSDASERSELREELDKLKAQVAQSQAGAGAAAPTATASASASASATASSTATATPTATAAE